MMNKNSNCPFCDKKIIARQKIWETDTEYVLYNIRKTNKGRCLIVPKRHILTFNELNDIEILNLFKTAQVVSQVLSKYLKPNGINYGWNEGTYAGQMINHFHLHILPRYKNDKVLKHHLFHGNPKTKQNLDLEELSKLVTEFEKIFKQIKKLK